MFVFICVNMRMSGISCLLLIRANEAAATAATSQQLLQHIRVLLSRGERERERRRERAHACCKLTRIWVMYPRFGSSIRESRHVLIALVRAQNA